MGAGNGHLRTGGERGEWREEGRGGEGRAGDGRYQKGGGNEGKVNAGHQNELLNMTKGYL